MPSDWNPPQYLRYNNERIRAAIDLLKRIDLKTPAVVYDLGCGTGNTIALLKKRWPDAKITGVDSSPAMLQQAQADLAGATGNLLWQHADLANWTPDTPPDLLYSNAAFHWIDQHEKVFPRLFHAVKPGGVLAVQMPIFFWLTSTCGSARNGV
jgi:trans-aconitate 2-methyltransferase